jgi:predicted DNA-binding antitoxin AbrB/MazE fold protein
MTITVEAVYENGVFKPKQTVGLDEGTEVRLILQTEEDVGDPREAVIGIGDGPPQRDGAQNHDKYILDIGNKCDDPFEAVIGTCDGPPDAAANHDKYLYGDRR